MRASFQTGNASSAELEKSFHETRIEITGKGDILNLIVKHWITRKNLKMKKKAVIIGAGPAGLTAAYCLLKQFSDIHPVILEELNEVGGISRTVSHEGNRIDLGGHRFFSKSQEVMDFWKEHMPIQGFPALDDKLLHSGKKYVPGGPDPETADRVLLLRNRFSRILYLRKFFDYPISIRLRTFLNLGFFRTAYAAFGYLYSMCFKKDEKSLKDFMINRFGAPLYRMFFEKYTEKVWGRNPDAISASWGAQRIRGVSISELIRNVLRKRFMKNGKVETSLIDEFLYPKKGPGQFWESLAEEIESLGGEIRRNMKVVRAELENGKITAVTALSGGEEITFQADYFLSSMPVKDLIESIGKDAVPPDVYQNAAELPYRDFVTVGLETDRLKLKNQTGQKTVNNIIPDCWIYIQEPDVRIGRLQIFNNWSPYMVREPLRKVWIGLEYFCSEGDELWRMDDREFIHFAAKELEKIGVIEADSITSSIRIKVKKAYPAYFGSYENFGLIRNWLDTISNLYCIGRNGQHRYNNMDHSMLSAMCAANLIGSGSDDKSRLWDINTEAEYHEAG